MKNKMIYVVISIITLLVLISTGALCNQCKSSHTVKTFKDDDKERLSEITEHDKSKEDTNEIEYKTAFGIDYQDPGRYLSQGEQSQISDKTFLKSFQTDTKGIPHLCKIYLWLKDDFDSYSAGGKNIGKVTADELLDTKNISGCHDYALVFSAVIRELGYPATMVRSSSIVWIKDFKKLGDNARPRIGHVFVEAYLNNKWVLVDPANGWYLDEDYDPTDPVIPLKGNIAGQTEETYGFYVERKGIDVWEMGIYDQDDSGKSMDELASKIDPDNIVYPDYDFERFS